MPALGSLTPVMWEVWPTIRVAAVGEVGCTTAYARAVPVGPVNPVGPFGPCSPVTPRLPVAPRPPAGPRGPGAPIGPRGPLSRHARTRRPWLITVTVSQRRARDSWLVGCVLVPASAGTAMI